MFTAKHTCILAARAGSIAVLVIVAAVAQQQPGREVPISLSALLEGDGFVRIDLW